MLNILSKAMYDEAMAKTLHYLVDMLPMANFIRYQIHELIKACSFASRINTITSFV